jgi:uncharacterized protein YktB (UPF0637 family)
MSFPGFTPEDFDVFLIPDFAPRMAAIRAEIRPKLVALGEDLAAKVEALTGAANFPHTAQHMRRRVNPPVETWVAFGRDRKGYKRWTHYRVAISAEGVRVTVFVEDDADDKPQLGAALEKSSAKLLRAVAKEPVLWYTLGEEPIAQSALTKDALAKAGSGLQRLKTTKFQAGIPLAREGVGKLSPEQFEEWAAGRMEVLRPLYLAGVTGKVAG